MKNKIKSSIFILLIFFLIFKSVNANEPFLFNITEIEISEDGNQINGFKGGTATSEDGSTITAKNFYYNKLTNILETIGDVKYFDKTKNIVITTDKAIYFKNEEKFFTTGNSKAVNENNTITASSLEYDKVNNIFRAKKNAIANDLKQDTTIYADEITYLKNEEKFFTQGETEAIIKKNINLIQKMFLILEILEIYFPKKSHLWKMIMEIFINWIAFHTIPTMNFLKVQKLKF